MERPSHAHVQLSDRPHQLDCVPVGSFVVCVLSPSAPHDPEPWERLTPRERDVLELVAEGRTTPEIAELLGISDKTARTHVEHMRTRLGVNTRAELVARCFRVGLLQ